MQRMGMAEHHTDVPTTGCKPHTPFQDQIACWKSHLRIHALAPCHKGYNSLPQMSKGRRDDATNSLKKEPEIKEKSRDEIYKMIRKRLEVNNITSVEKEDIDIQKTVNDVKVTVDYQAKAPLFGNVALAFSFHKSTVMH